MKRELTKRFSKLLWFIFIIFTSFPFQLVAQSLNGVLLTEKALSGIVKISVAEHGEGTGFIVGVEETAYILTNFHVLADKNLSAGRKIPPAHRISLSNHKNETFECTGIINYDTDFDLALLSFKNINSIVFTVLPILPVAEEPMASEIATIGNPLWENFSYSHGSVSKFSEDEGEFLVRTSMPLNPGNSGGPVFNKQGQVVGVVIARITHLFDGEVVQGFNYYINAHSIRDFLVRTKINYVTEPLILLGELTGRELSWEEQQAIIEKNIRIQVAEQEKEIARINKQKEAELELLESEKKYRANEAYRREIEAQIESQRKLIEIEKEKERLALENTRRKEQERAARANLPPRFSTRIGFGALVYGGNADYIIDYVETGTELYSPAFAPTGQLSVGFRFLSNPGLKYSKATSLNIFMAGGSYNSTKLERILMEYPDAIFSEEPSDFNPFFEVEGGFLLNEWFRISAGKGRQLIYNNSYSVDYGTLTMGFIIPGKLVEPDFLFSALYGNQREQIGFRFHLLLNLHFNYLKF
ncbi:MAG: trypsin-like peptidase domain-containing protein [Draconibacterium sp.]|nr:trypsin-like peptidase domain-containing protein [Draconibacterium sp.]